MRLSASQVIEELESQLCDKFRTLTKVDLLIELRKEVVGIETSFFIENKGQ